MCIYTVTVPNDHAIISNMYMLFASDAVEKTTTTVSLCCQWCNTNWCNCLNVTKLTLQSKTCLMQEECWF